MPPLVSSFNFKNLLLKTLDPGGEFSGNYYITSVSGFYGSQTSGSDLSSIPASASAIRIDNRGNIFTVGGAVVSAGFGLPDVLVSKYRNDGTLVWQKVLGSADSDGAYGLDLDSAGNLYVAGTILVQGGSPTYELDRLALLFKVNTDGGVVWAKTMMSSVDGSTGLVATKVVVHDTNVFMLFNSAVAKYSTDGEFLWANYNAVSGGPYSPIGYSIEVDQYGDVVFVGWTGYPSVITRNTNGAVTTAFSCVDNPGRYNDVAVDSVGNRISVGLMTVSTTYAVCVDKMSRTGTRVWQKTFGSLLGATSYWANGVCVDLQDNIYITGFTITQTTPTTYRRQLFIAKYSPDGDVLWQRVLRSSVITEGVSVQAVGSAVYVVGYRSISANVDKELILLKLPADGSLVYEDSDLALEQTGYPSVDRTTAITSAIMSSLYLVSMTHDSYQLPTKSLPANTGELFAKQIVLDGLTVTSVFVSQSGSRYILASSNVVKFDSSGNFLFAKGVGSGSSFDFTGITADTAGNIYLAGRSSMISSYGKAVIVKLDSSASTVLWCTELGNYGESYGFKFENRSITVDPATGVVTALGTLRTSVYNYNATYIQLSAAGGKLLAYNCGMPTGVTQYTFHKGIMAVGGYNYFLVSGGSAGLRLCKSNMSGALVWAVLIPTSVGADLVVDGSGNSYVCGQYSGGTYLSGLVVKIDSLGAFMWARLISTDPTGSTHGMCLYEDALLVSSTAGGILRFSTSGDLVSQHTVPMYGHLAVSGSDLLVKTPWNLYTIALSKLFELVPSDAVVSELTLSIGAGTSPLSGYSPGSYSQWWPTAWVTNPNIFYIDMPIGTRIDTLAISQPVSLHESINWYDGLSTTSIAPMLSISVSAISASYDVAEIPEPNVWYDSWANANPPSVTIVTNNATLQAS